MSLLLIGTHVNKIDKKGRVSVPAQFRAALSESGSSSIFLFPSFTAAALEAWPHQRMEQLVDSLDSLDPFSEPHDDLSTSLMSHAHPLTFDPEGRIILPSKLLSHAKLDDLACFVGHGRTFQIWNPDAFDERLVSAREGALANRGELRWKRDPEKEGA